MCSKAAKPIQGNMHVIDIIALIPGAQHLLLEYGLHCARCALNTIETLEEGCLGHGMQDEDVEDLLNDLNELFASQPERAEEITVTKAGAEALREILEREGGMKQDFLITFDKRGGFCLECSEETPSAEHNFFHPDVPKIRIFVDSLILRRVGGAVIDMREGRFTLDIPGEIECCSDKDTCTCI